jgi:alpha-tubulin suppressor-like RCC1 family protein
MSASEDVEPPNETNWRLVPNMTGIAHLASAGDEHFAVTSEGRVYGWGRGGPSLFGPNATTQNNLYRVDVGLSHVEAVATGSYPTKLGHALFLVRQPSGESEILALGNDNQGQLGNPPAGESTGPTPVTVLNPEGTGPLRT